jgi:Fe-S cluster biogenesis protein NfuA
MLDSEVHERVARVEGLVEEVAGDPAAFAALQAIVALYGEALRRIGNRFGPAIADDELVAHLLLVHGLHPVDVEQRVADALDSVRPYLGSHGGDVELVGVAGTVARVRLHGSCDGCASSRVTLRNAIEAAILQAAPELERVEAEEPAERLLQISRVAPGPCLPGTRV